MCRPLAAVRRPLVSTHPVYPPVKTSLADGPLCLVCRQRSQSWPIRDAMTMPAKPLIQLSTDQLACRTGRTERGRPTHGPMPSRWFLVTVGSLRPQTASVPDLQFSARLPTTPRAARKGHLPPDPQSPPTPPGNRNGAPPLAEGREAPGDDSLFDGFRSRSEAVVHRPLPRATKPFIQPFIG